MYSRHTETHTHTLTSGRSNLLMASTRQALYWSRNKLKGRRRLRLEWLLQMSMPIKLQPIYFDLYTNKFTKRKRRKTICMSKMLSACFCWAFNEQAAQPGLEGAKRNKVRQKNIQDAPVLSHVGNKHRWAHTGCTVLHVRAVHQHLEKYDSSKHIKGQGLNNHSKTLKD